MATTPYINKVVKISTLRKVGYVEFDGLGLVYDQIKKCRAGDIILYHLNKKTRRYVCTLANDLQIKKWAQVYIQQKHLKSPFNTTLQNFKRMIRAVDTDDNIFVSKAYI